MLLIAFNTMLIFSCQKNESKTIDKEKLNLTISKPTEAQQFNNGDTVFIKASAQYIAPLHGYSIKISDGSLQKTYFEIEQHLHETAFNIDTFWVNQFEQNVDLKLTLTVEVDHDGNEVKKTINFSSK